MKHNRIDRRSFLARASWLMLSAPVAASCTSGSATAFPQAGDTASNLLMTASPAVQAAIKDVVIANRILAHQEVVDAYGHVSVRHPEKPDHFLLSRSLSPEFVTPADVMEIRLDGTVVGDDDRHPYLERFIHGSFYEQRPEINAVAHAHTHEVLPFTVSSTPLRPVIHNAGVVGETIPVWDMRDEFGDTDLLVMTEEQSDDLASVLGSNNIVLMRAHGFSAAGRNLIELMRMCIYLKLNAKVLAEALRLGDVKYLSKGEIAQVRSWDINSSAMQRAWIYWAEQAGCAHLLDEK